MEQIKIPAGYQSSLNLHDTQIAIKTVKDFFQQTLAQKLNLLRVSAPVFVNPSSGLNDNLNGVERPQVLLPVYSWNFSLSMLRYRMRES